MADVFLRRAPIFEDLDLRLSAGPQIIQVIIGPRQVGKTTTLRRYLETAWAGSFIYATADSPTPPTALWLTQRWEEARALAAVKGHVLLALDEVQKVPRWDEAVKACFDEDRYQRTTITPVILGSSALLMGRGLSESLAGRFELIRFPHWSFHECREAFQASLDEYLYFGSYPAGYSLRNDPRRWRSFILDSIVDATINRDILGLAPIEKPALFRQTFAMACQYPGQIMAYQKFLGQLVDAGNTTTIAHYLELLSRAFLLAPVPKWSARPIRTRASSPKLIILNNALVAAVLGKNPSDLRADREQWGRLVENAVGAHLINSGLEVFYWRDRDMEVDFVVRYGDLVTGIEVTSGVRPSAGRYLEAFRKRFPKSRTLRIGGSGADIALEEFLGSSPMRGALCH